MELLSYVFFALALNLDSFGAGMAYGSRQIYVPVSSLCIISLISVAAITISMLGGQILLAALPVTLAQKAGGILLMLIGLWVLYQTRRDQERVTENTASDKNSTGKTIKIHIRPLGLVIQILKEPTRADLDKSGVISPSEATILGVALAMDAFAAGFAVSILGFSIILTAAVVGVGHFFLTYLGLLAGRSVTKFRLGRRLTTLPGCLLIVLGLLKLFY